jgi:hypothetical protein
MFLLQIFIDRPVSIMTTEDKDKFGWLGFCAQIKHFTRLQPTRDIDYTRYEVFKITSHDLFINSPESIAIYHLIKRRCASRRGLTFFPKIAKPGIQFVLPVFRPPGITSAEVRPSDRTVLLVGVHAPEDLRAESPLGHLVRKNKDFHFHLVVGEHGRRAKHQFPPNCTFHYALKTPELIKLFESTDLVLGRNNPYGDRYSGYLGIAVSFLKKMVVHRRIRKYYGCPVSGVFDCYADLRPLGHYLQHQNHLALLEFREENIAGNTRTVFSVLNRD